MNIKSLKNTIVRSALFTLVMLFVACSDSDVTSPVENLPESSSEAESSSSAKLSSSSLEILSSSTKQSSSSVKQSSSSSVVSSSSLLQSSSSVSASSTSNSSIATISSSSNNFVIPEKNISIPKTLTLEEVREVVLESHGRNFFAQDSFTWGYEINQTGGKQSVSVAQKRKDLFSIYEETSSINLTNRIVVSGDEKRVFVNKSNTTTPRSITPEERDTFRNKYTKDVLLCPFDSGAWSAPVQLTDDIFRLDSDDGRIFYYNATTKSIELYLYTVENEQINATYEFRYDYASYKYIKTANNRRVKYQYTVAKGSAAGQNVTFYSTLTVGSLWQNYCSRCENLY